MKIEEKKISGNGRVFDRLTPVFALDNSWGVYHTDPTFSSG